MSNISTGWFGVSGMNNEHLSTKVHLVDNDKPICGSRLRKDMEYQWCSITINLEYLECGNCKKSIIVKKEIEKLKKRIKELLGKYMYE